MSNPAKLQLLGPTARTGPLWEATLAAGYLGKPGKPVIENTQALRVLVQDGAPTPLTVGGATKLFHKPRLLQIAGEAGSGLASLELGTGPHRRLDVHEDTRLGLFDAVVAPHEPAAPWPTPVANITPPKLRLAAGRIDLWGRLSPVTPNEQHWLGHKARTKLLFADDAGAGIECFCVDASGWKWLPLSLTPEGVEFYALVPDPRQAFDDGHAMIWAQLRLVERSGDAPRPYALAFVRAVAEPVSANWSFPAPPDLDGHALALEAQFVHLFDSVRKDFGIRVDFDQRPATPPLVWPLAQHASGRPLFPAVTEGWTAQLDPELFRVNILSRIDGFPASATVRVDHAALSFKAAGSQRRLTLGSGKSAPGQVTLNRVPGGDWTAVAGAQFDSPRLPLEDTRRRLAAMYEATKLIDPQVDKTVHAFAPVRGGWLQLPLRATPNLSPVKERESVLSGEAAFALVGRTTQLELRGAAKAGLEIAIEPGKPPSCDSVVLSVAGGSGRVRGLMHIADCSPADGEILPRLRFGATCEWPVVFGVGDRSDCIDIKALDLAARSMILDLQPAPAARRGIKGKKSKTGEAASTKPLEAPPLAWLRDGAWISSINLAQAAGSGQPVAARSLVPRTLGASCTLTWAAGAELPALGRSDVKAAWDVWLNGEGSVEPATQLLPTLPGLERHGVTDPGKFTYTLRHDLPPLDDLFASMQLEDAPLFLLGEEKKAEKARSPLASAAAPHRLQAAWRVIRENVRSTHTRYRTAVDKKPSGKETDIENIALPYKWANVSFSFHADNGSQLPLGRYMLDTEDYAGGKALAGLGNLVTLGSGANAVTLQLKGNAAPRWRRAANGPLFDMVGVGYATAASSKRAITFLRDGKSQDNFELLTLDRPVALERQVSFWCRDLPIEGKDSRFSWEDRPDSPAGRVDMRRPDLFARSAYEWRLWADGDGETSDIPLSSGFVARPLRLHQASFDEGSLTHLEVLATLLAPSGLDITTSSQPGESTAAGNLLLLTYKATGSGSFTRTVARVGLQNHKPVPTSEPAGFDLRPVVCIGGQCGSRAARLEIGVDARGMIQGGKLSVKLFGHDLVLEQAGSASDQSISFRTKSGAATNRIRIESPTLSWVLVGKQHRVSLEMEAFADLPVASPQHPFAASIDLGRNEVRNWYGLRLSGLRVELNHDQGSILVGVDEPAISGGSVMGLHPVDGDANAVLGVDKDLNLFGFALLRARDDADKETRFALRHKFETVGGRWTDALSFDLATVGESTVKWPTTVTPQAPASRKARARAAAEPLTLKIEPGVLSHKVDCAVKSLPVPPPSLDANGQLVRPLRLAMRVNHELRDTQGETAPLRWTTLDEAMLVDLGGLATGKDESYAFAARYDGQYRGKSDKLLAPGIVPRVLAAAGFPDELMLRAIKSAPQPVKGPLLCGAGVAFVGGDDGKSHLLALPWMLKLSDAVLGPLAELRQSPAVGSLRWKVPQFDGRAATIDISARPTLLALADTSTYAVNAQLSGGGSGAMQRDLAFVEQPFFEADAGGAIELGEAPIFLRSIVALNHLRDALLRSATQNPDLQANLVQPLIRPNESCGLFAPSMGHAAANPPAPVLMALGADADGVAFSLLDPELGVAGGGSGGASSVQLLRQLQEGLMPKATLFTLARVQPSGGDPEAARHRNERGTGTSRRETWAIEPIAPIVSLRRPKQSPAPRPLRQVTTHAFGSPALGWPEDPELAGAPVALGLGENLPFQSDKAALAGRTAAYANRAGARKLHKHWFAQHRQVVFEAAATAEEMAPAPRHHDVAPRRVRGSLGQPTITPAAIATASVGSRPGTMFLQSAALLSLVGNRRATLHPVVTGQDRSPRSTLFPADVVDLNWRRETIVWRGDSERCRIEPAPAIAFRTYRAKARDPSGVVVLRSASQTVDLEGVAEITLLVDQQPADRSWEPYDWRQFRFRIGNATWPLDESRNTGSSTLTLRPSGQAAVAEMRAAARSITGDTAVACELLLAKTGPRPQTGATDPLADEPAAAPALILQLPLAVVMADEPRLTVTTPTLIFGDPAYDRMLGSATASDAKRDAAGDLFVFATDREAYDPASPLLVAFGRDGGTPQWPDYELTIERVREGDEKPTPLITRKPMAGGVAGFTIQQLAIAGTTSIEPGDRLALSASVRGSVIDLQLQVSIQREPVLPPAPAIYNFVTLHNSGKDAATALSASGPFPSQIEYPSLEEDMLKGYVHRRGLFVWRFAAEPEADGRVIGYVVKIDRSGAGQLPSTLGDFAQAQGPARKRRRKRVA